MSIEVSQLTHWGQVTHICVSNLTIIGSDIGLSPDQRQAIICTNAGIFLIEPLETNFEWKFNRNSNIFILQNALENVVCKMASILSLPQCVNTKGQKCRELWSNHKKRQIYYHFLIQERIPHIYVKILYLQKFDIDLHIFFSNAGIRTIWFSYQ